MDGVIDPVRPQFHRHESEVADAMDACPPKARKAAKTRISFGDF
jgi:hypothetical protein